MNNLQDILNSVPRYWPHNTRAMCHAIISHQLSSGGWLTYFAETDDERVRMRYLVRGDRKGVDRSMLDNGATTRCVKLLMDCDDGTDKLISDSITHALEAILRAQFSNGAWPQGWPTEPSHPEIPEDLHASYPDEWPWGFPGDEGNPWEVYWQYCTINDYVMSNTIRTLWQAADKYGDERFEEAARNGCEFLLLAQMPSPQPAWCQQYDYSMQPRWARKYEPPSITGMESQKCVRVLFNAYRRTDDMRYARAAIKAMDYLEQQRLGDGRIPRFLELQTDKPLYVNTDYELTYEPENLIDHYTLICPWILE